MLDLQLAGGPGAGYYQRVHAAPRVLLAVVGAGGQQAVLDEPGDQVGRDEQAHAYTWDTRRGPMFVDGRYADGQRRGWKVISYRYLGPVDRDSGEIAEIPVAESEQLADEYDRAQARRYLLDTKSDRIPSHVRDRLARAAATTLASDRPASPQGQLF